MAPERWSRGASASPAIDVWSLGIILFELLTGTRPISDAELGTYVYEPRTISWPEALLGLPAGGVLARTLSPDPASRPSAAEVVEALTALTTGAITRGDQPPFRGLRAFAEADAPDLVGRELDVDHALESMRRHGFVLVAGPSGLGKSSLLAAGLMPRLKESGARCPAPFRPGPEPLRRLAAALDLQPAAVEQLARRPALAAAFALRLPRLVLLIDQLEEAFTLAAESERTVFFEALRALLESRACQLVLGLRDDHLGAVGATLTSRILTGAVLLEPLSREKLAQAILQPLRRVGASVDDPALVDRLVADVSRSPVALPLLQFVCQLLWDVRDRRAATIRLADYEALGGASGALAAHAERTLQLLTPAERRLARALVLRLVTAGGSRVPCRESTLLEAVPGAESVISRLVEERLLVVTREAEDDASVVEFAHEALIAAWPSLKRWLDETQEDRTLRDDVEQAAARWVRQAERDEDTWSGSALLIALEREASRPLGLSQGAQRFLQAGRRRSEAARRRARWRLTAFVAGLSLVAVGGIVATTITLSQQRQIRLAASNSGEFELRLRPFRFSADGGKQWVAARDAAPVEWSLGPAPISRSASHEQVMPYGPDSLERRDLASSADVAAYWVRVPAAPALLRVRLRDCPPSLLRLEGLPGYQRSSGELQVLEVPVPLCETASAEHVLVAAGPFLSERDRRVELAAFEIDAHEVTAAQFAAWAALSSLTGEDAIPMPAFASDDPQKPMVGVTAVQAEAFCNYLGRRLPTSDEWLKAARGGLKLPDGTTNPAPSRSAPWAEPESVGRANWAVGDEYPYLAPVGRFPLDQSPLGVFDLAGNATEWTATPATSNELRGLRIVRGGNWDSSAGAPDTRVDFANTRPALAVDYGVGFRCAASITPAGG
jgi:hypothetical protein